MTRFPSSLILARKSPHLRQRPHLHHDTRVGGDTLLDLVSTRLMCCSAVATHGPQLSSLLSDGASDGGSLHLTLGVDDLKFLVSSCSVRPDRPASSACCVGLIIQGVLTTPALSSKYRKTPSVRFQGLDWRTMTAGWTFFRSSGFPFLTVAMLCRAQCQQHRPRLHPQVYECECVGWVDRMRLSFAECLGDCGDSDDFVGLGYTYTMSPTPPAGSLFRRAPIPLTEMMYRFRAPELSAQFMMAPL